MGAYLLFAVLSGLTAWGVITVCRHFGVEVPFLLAVFASPFILEFVLVLLVLLWICIGGASVYLAEKIKKWKGK